MLALDSLIFILQVRCMQKYFGFSACKRMSDINQRSRGLAPLTPNSIYFLKARVSGCGQRGDGTVFNPLRKSKEDQNRSKLSFALPR